MRNLFWSCWIAICFVASPVFSQSDQKVGTGIQSVRIYEWNPGNQTLGRFVEKCIKSWQNQADAQGFIIFIGQDSERFWTLEGGLENDAEDFPFFAQLAETFPDGKRKIHSLPPHKFKGNAPDALMKQVWDWDKIGLLPKTESLKKIPWKKGEGQNSEIATVAITAGKNLCWRFIILTHTGTCANDFRWEAKILASGN